MIENDGLNSLVKACEQAAQEISNAGIPICKFGLFGSAVYDPKVVDVDILLTLDLPGGDQSDFGDVIKVTNARMEGDYTENATVNKAARPFVRACTQAIEAATGFPLVYGLGPSNKHNYKGRWVHLNGPVSDEVWSLFVKEYPLHGLAIRENYRPIIGEPFAISPITGETLLEYCQYKTRRDKLMPTIKGADKLIRVLAILGGEHRAVRDAAIDKVYGWNGPLAERLHSFFRENSNEDASPITLALVEAVTSVAHLMQVLDMEYPRDWNMS